MRGIVRAIRPLVEPRKFVLTGTPVSESPTNAYPILQILSPEKLPSRAKYDRHFATGEGGYSNLGDLKRLLESVSVRRLKADIRGMPDKIEVVRHCDPTDAQATHYAEVMKGIMAEIEGDPDWAKTLDIACVKLLRCRQVLNHPSILDLGGESGKYLELDSILEEVLSDSEAKVIVWTEWNAAADLLATRYRRYGVAIIDQRTNQDDLAALERTFDGSSTRIIVTTPAKGGTGIDFLARARTSIYIERTYSLVNHKQSMDRIVRRVGDDNTDDPPAVRRVKQIKRSSATIMYLHVPGSVDDVIEYVLRRKLEMTEALLTSDERLVSDGRMHLLRMLRERVCLHN